MSAGTTEVVQSEMHDGVLLARIDNGKVNALSTPVLEGLAAALDRVDKEEARGLVITGKPGYFSAGFDLREAEASKGGVGAMFLAGGQIAVRLLEARCPVVMACPGHAVAMGAVFLMTADYRIGARGSFKIGLNEVAIGLGLPELAVDLVQARISKRWATRVAALSEILDPETAVDAGFLDRTVHAEELIEDALETAKRLAALDPRAHLQVKRALRGEIIERARLSMAAAQN